MRARGVLVAAVLVVATGCGADPRASTSRAPTPTPSPSERQCDASCLVVGPSTSTHTRRGAENDLMTRLLLLEKNLTRESSDVPKDGEYLTLDDLLGRAPAAVRTKERAALTTEGFEGALRDVWDSTYTSEVYDVALWRFATAAGAREQLRTYVDYAGIDPASTYQAHPAVPGGLAFLGEHVGFFTHHRGFDEYFTRGRYLAFVTIRSGRDLAGVDLATDGDILSKAQYDRMAP